jgi:tetratricopeptide (TPR) repeat protein
VSGFVAAPALLRLENALVAYARYLGKSFWPVNLAVPYMNPVHWSWLEVGGAVLVLVGVWLAVLWVGWRRPYLLVGWCWFWGMLIPVIGLTKGWGSFMADRFTYLPSIGVLLLAVWGAYELVQGKAEVRGQKSEVGDTQAATRTRVQSPIANRQSQILLWLAGGAAIGFCGVLTWQQLSYWQDSESLFRHVIEVTENNHIAYNNLAHAVLARGQSDEAIGLYEQAIRLKPDYAAAHNNLGVALGQIGQIDEAIRHFQKAIQFKPDYADAYNNLGGNLSTKGQLDEAIRQLQEALRLRPDYADARNNLGIAFGQKGQLDEAIRQYQEAVRLKPDHAQAHYNLGAALDNKGLIGEAIGHYEEALRLKPDDADVHNNLGIALGKQGQTDEAIHHYQEALRLNPGYAEAHNNLGTAFYQQGRATEAIQQFQEALRLKPDYADARRNLTVAFDAKANVPPPTGPATRH